MSFCNYFNFLFPRSASTAILATSLPCLSFFSQCVRKRRTVAIRVWSVKGLLYRVPDCRSSRLDWVPPPPPPQASVAPPTLGHGV